MKKIIFLPFLFFLFSCEEKFENPYRENILGQWQLVQVINYLDTYQDPDTDTIDYTFDNIIYHFTSDTLLIINTSLPNNYIEGEHSYHYSELNVCPTCLPGLNLRIDNDHYYCEAKKTEIVMSFGHGASSSGEKKIWMFIKLN